MNDQKKYLDLRGYVGYTCLIPGSCILNTLIGSFLLIFATNWIGMNSAIVGTLMLVAKIFDGVTDLLFGAIMDRTKHRLGKARPWVIRNIAPLILCGILLFFTPVVRAAGASGGMASGEMASGEMAQPTTWSYVYFFIFYVLYSAVCYTVCFMSNGALPIRMTRNEHERVKLGVISVIPQMAIGIGMSFVIMNWVGKLGGGVAAWRTLAIIFGVVQAILMGIGALFCKELPEEVLSQGEPSKPQEKFSFREMIRSVAGNRFVWLLFAYTIVFAISTAASAQSGTYYVRYVLHNDSMLGFVVMAGMGPMIISLFFTPALSKKFGIYKLLSRGYLLATVFMLLVLIFAMLRMPIPMFVCMVLRGLCSGPFTGLGQAVNGQVIEYSRVKDGRDITGSLLGISNLGGKIGEGLSSGLIGWLLAAGHYDGTLAVQPDSAINMIIFVFAGLPFIAYILQTIFFWFLNPVQATEKILKERGEEIPEGFGAGMMPPPGMKPPAGMEPPEGFKPPEGVKPPEGFRPSDDE